MSQPIDINTKEPINAEMTDAEMDDYRNTITTLIETLTK